MSASSWVLATVPLADLNAGVFPNHRTDLGASDGSLDALVESVRTWGVLTPILLARTAQGMAVIAGHRRLHAARAVGLATIPAQIAPEGLAGEDRPLSAALVENLQRKDLNPMEEARSFAALQQRGWSQERIGLLIGRSQAYVSRLLGLLRLPAPVIELLESKRLDTTFGFALFPLLTARVSEGKITELAQCAVERGATLRQLELAVEQLLASKGILPRRAAAPAPTTTASAPSAAPLRTRRPSPKAVLAEEAPALVQEAPSLAAEAPTPEPVPEDADPAPLTRGDLLRGLLTRIQSEAKSSGCPVCATCYDLAGEALELLAEDRP